MVSWSCRSCRSRWYFANTFPSLHGDVAEGLAWHRGHGAASQDRCRRRCRRPAVGAGRSQGRRGRLDVCPCNSAHTSGARRPSGLSGADNFARAQRVNLVCWRVRERGPCLLWVPRRGRSFRGCGSVWLELVDRERLCVVFELCSGRLVGWTPRLFCDMCLTWVNRGRARRAWRGVRRDAS